MSDEQSKQDRRYWRANNRLILCLLTVWASVSFLGGIIFVEQLNKFTIGALPLGFWIAQQGSIYVFVILIFIYALAMDRLDRIYARPEQGKSPERREGGAAGDARAASDEGDAS